MVARRASAEDATIASAEAAYARGALREANRLFVAAWHEPGHDRAELVRIHVHLGILAGAMGAERGSSAHFAIALALDPQLATPAELGGRDRARFERARRGAALALHLEAPTHAETGASFRVEVSVTAAPAGLVRRVELACSGTALPAEATLRAGQLDGATATVPAGACGTADVVIIATALDEFGGVLAHHEARIVRGSLASADVEHP